MRNGFYSKKMIKTAGDEEEEDEGEDEDNENVYDELNLVEMLDEEFPVR